LEERTKGIGGEMSKVNVPFAILSLVTSVLLWASVYNEKNDKPTQRPENAVVILRDFDDKKFVITQSQEFVNLTLSGYARDFRSINPQSITAIVDLKEPKLGENSYPVIVFPAAVRELMGSSSPLVKIKVERLVTKRVDVTYVPIGSLKSGFQLDSVDMFSPWIYITGPSETIDRVYAVQVVVNLSAISDSPQEFELDPRPVDANKKTVPNVMFSETETHDPYKFNDVENVLKVKTTVKFVPDAPIAPKK
jgi:YbbR domain-containing protein